MCTGLVLQPCDARTCASYFRYRCGLAGDAVQSPEDFSSKAPPPCDARSYGEGAAGCLQIAQEGHPDAFYVDCLSDASFTDATCDSQGQCVRGFGARGGLGGGFQRTARQGE